MSQKGSGELLGPFIQALETKRAVAVPQETVLGATTHFLSTSSLADLPRVIEAVAGSDYLWSSDEYAGSDLGRAVSLGVLTRVDSDEKRHQSSWWANRKSSNASCRWLETIHSALEAGKGTNLTLLELRAGLLAGVALSDNVNWADMRIKLEEDVILGISQLGLSTYGQRELAIVSDVVNHIDASRLLVLDLQSLLPFIERSLLASLDSDEPKRVKPSKLAVALGRFFEVLSKGKKGDREYLRESSERFVAIMRERARATEPHDYSAETSDVQWNKQKTALFSFLVPSSKLIDIMLGDYSDSHPATFGKRSGSELCISIVATLAAFSPITQQSNGGLEGHDRVLYGALDIIVAIDGTEGVKRLFGELAGQNISEPRAAFLLQCGGQLVDDMDSSTLANSLLPLAQEYLNKPQVKGTFEHAHAFMAATINSTARPDERPLPQAAFAGEVVPYYSHLLIKQLLQGDISTDHFRQSCSLTIDLASKVSDELASRCIEQLNDAANSDAEQKHTLMLARISAAQFVSITRLRAYLDELATGIAETPAGDKRLELAANAFGMVVRELGDEQKKIGIDWWLERKRQIEGKDRSKPGLALKAKL